MPSPKSAKKCRRKLEKYVRANINPLSTDFSFCSLFFIRKMWRGHSKPSKGKRRRLSSSASSEKSGDIHGQDQPSDTEQPIPEPTHTRERTYYTDSEGDSAEDDYEDANNNNSY